MQRRRERTAAGTSPKDEDEVAHRVIRDRSTTAATTDCIFCANWCRRLETNRGVESSAASTEGSAPAHIRCIAFFVGNTRRCRCLLSVSSPAQRGEVQAPHIVAVRVCVSRIHTSVETGQQHHSITHMRLCVLYIRVHVYVRVYCDCRYGGLTNTIHETVSVHTRKKRTYLGSLVVLDAHPPVRITQFFR